MVSRDILEKIIALLSLQRCIRQQTYKLISQHILFGINLVQQKTFNYRQIITHFNQNIYSYACLFICKICTYTYLYTNCTSISVRQLFGIFAPLSLCKNTCTYVQKQKIRICVTQRNCSLPKPPSSEPHAIALIYVVFV